MPGFVNNISIYRNSRKRKDNRIEKKITVSFTVLPSDPNMTPIVYGHSQTSDISRSGLCLLMNRKVKPPIMLQLTIRFDSIKKSIPMLGKVIWYKRTSEVRKYKIGIKFIGKLPEDLENILAKT